MLAPAQESPQDWSDQETLLLLEGMEMYGESWAEIAEHVGTRSQVCIRCLVHCLGLTDNAGQCPSPGVAMASVGELGRDRGAHRHPLPGAPHPQPCQEVPCQTAVASLFMLRSLIAPHQ